MGQIGYGYGSEWHLLRQLGRHRSAFSDAVLTAIGGESISWLDFGYSSKGGSEDRELEGLEFIDNPRALEGWRDWWPQTGRSMNWDAVAEHQSVDGQKEWLLVEAKGNVKELESDCGAGPASRQIISRAFTETQTAMGVGVGFERWMEGHYQYANRLAVLHFLLSQSVSTQLLFIYFCGDTTPNATCPADEGEWRPHLNAIYEHLGLVGTSTIEERVHTLFLSA